MTTSPNRTILTQNSTFLSAARKTNTGRIPVWMMRQAGRYLPEYQELRKKHDFRAMSHTPDLIYETTLQPLRRYEMDAAILFSDILTCLEFMGAPFHFGDEGPRLEDAGPHVLKNLKPLNPADHMSFVGEGIQKIVREITPLPLIGFVGAPFTLMSYLVEGGTSREFNQTRQLMLSDPALFVATADLLADSLANYLKFQVKCGVSAVQIFDSWAGFLSQAEYESFMLPSMQKLISKVKESGAPVILYSQPTTHLIPSLAQTGADVLSVDWRLTMGEYHSLLQSAGADMALQGNLNPLVTTLPWAKAEFWVRRMLADADRMGLNSRWIFNVGHGVTPQTNTETVARILELVHSHVGVRP